MKSRSKSNEVNANVCLGLSSLGFTFDSKLKFTTGRTGWKSARDNIGKLFFHVPISQRLLTSRLTSRCSFFELAGEQRDSDIVFIDFFWRFDGDHPGRLPQITHEIYREMISRNKSLKRLPLVIAMISGFGRRSFCHSSE